MYFECHIETNNLTEQQKIKLKESASLELFGFYSSVLTSDARDKTYFNRSNPSYNLLFEHMNLFCNELIRADICIKRKKIELIVFDEQ